MSIKLIALDLDGTLTNDKKEITKRTLETLFKAMDSGVKIALASGRPQMGITNLAEKLQLFSRGGYILSFNGGRVFECKSKKVLRERTIRADIAKKIAALNKLFDGVQIVTYSDSEIIAEGVNEYVKEESRCTGAKIRTVSSLSSSLPENVVKFLATGEHEKLLPVREYFEKNFSEYVDVYFSQSFFLEIVARGIDKAEAIEVIAKELKISGDEIMACGDGENDLPMKKAAGIFVAMDNALPEVKAAADFITADNNNDGVALAVEKFVFGSRT